jgi:chemotaxis protein methyltransferase CheR
MYHSNFIKSIDEFLSDNEFEKLSRFIYDQCGIKMPPVKKTMLETRLRKRLRVNNINSFGDYCDFLFSKKGMTEELIHMIDVVTTNKTDFFREPAQFTYLTQKAVPYLISEFNAGIENKLKIWSAGCSTGEEPYTLAIVLSELAQNQSNFDFSIIASDISTKVLEKALLGVYDLERIDNIPIDLKRKYFFKSKDPNKKLVRVIPGLRKFINFQRINFMDSDFGMSEKQDIIFCRNVIIYFDKPTQELLLKKFSRHLRTGGFLFLGHSETIFNMDVPMVQVAPSTYKKIK